MTTCPPTGPDLTALNAPSDIGTEPVDDRTPIGRCSRRRIRTTVPPDSVSIEKSSTASATMASPRPRVPGLAPGGRQRPSSATTSSVSPFVVRLTCTRTVPPSFAR